MSENNQGHNDQAVYKILTQTEWLKAREEGAFSGSLIDLRDGFIHLSTRDQVSETLRLHFSGQTELLLVEFGAKEIDLLIWEPSRGGQLFPHVYGKLDPAKARREWSIRANEEGIPMAPW